MERENNFDLLRIISTIAVILIHVNYMFFQYHWMNPDMGDAYYVVESIVNIITRFSVPCFVLLSGAFILRNKKNRDFRSFYRKAAYKIFLPLVGVILFLLALDEVYAALGSHKFLSPFKGILTGSFFNLWYMYMLGGLYFLAPAIIRLKECLSLRQYHLVTVVMLLWACISQASSHYAIAYSGGVVAAYISYFMAGDVIHSLPLRKEIRYKIVPAILSVLSIAVAFVARYFGFSYYLFDAYTNFFSPAVMIYSLSLFYLFKYVSISADCSWLSGKTFYIYMFHTLFIVIISKGLRRFLPQSELWAIVLVLLAVFVLALLSAVFYDFLWKMAEKDWKARERWYAFFDRVCDRYIY